MPIFIPNYKDRNWPATVFHTSASLMT